MSAADRLDLQIDPSVGIGVKVMDDDLALDEVRQFVPRDAGSRVAASR